MQIFTQDNFDTEVLGNSKPVLVDFFATWCGPCKMQAPILEELAAEVGDAAVFGKLDIDQDTELAIRYGVMAVPTLIIFKNGEVASTLTGVHDKDAIKKELI